MLIINPASAGSARYWERSAVCSTWLGHGATLLGLSGPVDVADLRAVMRGLDPGGVPLTSRPGLRQRQGWDLVFAAPKSVSLLVGTASASSAEPLVSAFRGAVADAVSVLEERAAWLRSGGEQVAARGVVAASFEHTANDAGPPAPARPRGPGQHRRQGGPGLGLPREQRAVALAGGSWGRFPVGVAVAP